jgi:hypothetical protein
VADGNGSRRGPFTTATRPGPWWADTSRKPRPWWESRQPEPFGAIPLDDLPDGMVPDEAFAPASELAPARSGRSSAPAFVVAFAALAVVLVAAHVADLPIFARVMVPVTGFLGTIAFARWLQPRHPEEPWLGKLLILGVLVKIVGAILRYTTLLKKGQLGDASVYDIAGKKYANAWLGKVGVTAPTLANLRASNFMRWFTGVVYYLFGRDLIAGFFVYSLIAFVGSYLWYRAAAVAIPFLDRRLFFILMFFAPSVVFWPAGVGKEALMQFGLGSVALGVAYILTDRMLHGFLVALPGGWLVYNVRAHLLGLTAIALAFAYVLGRRRRIAAEGASLFRPIGIVFVVLIAAFAVTQGAKQLHIAALTPDSIQAELQATSASTTQEGSAFNTNVSLSPLHLPQDAITVLLRPFPWEVQSKNQILASLEGMALVAFMILRRKSIALSLRKLREVPFLFYAWILTLLYVLLFQAFGNFGLLVRERSIVLPAMYVLLALDVKLANRKRPVHPWEEEEAALRVPA